MRWSPWVATPAPRRAPLPPSPVTRPFAPRPPRQARSRRCVRRSVHSFTACGPPSSPFDSSKGATATPVPRSSTAPRWPHGYAAQLELRAVILASSRRTVRRGAIASHPSPQGANIRLSVSDPPPRPSDPGVTSAGPARTPRRWSPPLRRPPAAGSAPPHAQPPARDAFTAHPWRIIPPCGPSGAASTTSTAPSARRPPEYRASPAPRYVVTHARRASPASIVSACVAAFVRAPCLNAAAPAPWPPVSARRP